MRSFLGQFERSLSLISFFDEYNRAYLVPVLYVNALVRAYVAAREYEHLSGSSLPIYTLYGTVYLVRVQVERHNNRCVDGLWWLYSRSNRRAERSYYSQIGFRETYRTLLYCCAVVILVVGRPLVNTAASGHTRRALVKHTVLYCCCAVVIVVVGRPLVHTVASGHTRRSLLVEL